MSFYFVQTFLLLFLTSKLSLTKAQNFNVSANEVDNSIIKANHSSELDEILNWESPQELKKNLPYFLSGYDDDECPVWITEIGKWDLRGQIEAVGFEPVQKHFRQMLTNFYTSAEWTNKLVEKSNQTASGEQIRGCENLEFNAIIDFDGFTNRQLAHPQTLTTFINGARAIFELEGKGQRVKRAFGINCNFFANALYSVGSPFLGSVANRVTILGTNPDSWKPKLLKSFPKSALPDWMGGSQDFKPLRVYG